MQRERERESTRERERGVLWDDGFGERYTL